MAINPDGSKRIMNFRASYGLSDYIERLQSELERVKKSSSGLVALDEAKLRALAHEYQDRTKPDGLIDILAFIKAIIQKFGTPKVSEEEIAKTVRIESGWDIGKEECIRIAKAICERINR